MNLLALRGVIEGTVIATATIMAVMGYADRDVPGALPPLLILSVEAEVIHASVAMRPPLSAE